MYVLDFISPGNKHTQIYIVFLFVSQDFMYYEQNKDDVKDELKQLKKK